MWSLAVKFETPLFCLLEFGHISGGTVNEEEKLKKTLFKKAVGYVVSEETVEYAINDEGKEVVTKRKVTKKYIPPDAAALRLLIERFFSSSYQDIDSMSDEELERERDEIIKMLKQEEKDAIESGKEKSV